MLKDVLQGKPIGHPLHPALVHLPIGLFVLSFILDVAGLLTDGGNHLVRGAFYCLVLGVLFALIAAMAGFADWSDIRRDHPAKRTANLHMLLNLVAVGLFIATAMMRYPGLERDEVAIGPFLLSVTAIIVLSFSGYLGGTMIYDDGIAVGRHRRPTRTPVETIRVGAEAADGFVAVASANELREKETLRVDLGGQVVTVVKLGGEFYALQEFCTHRYGPLSEGTFRDHEIMCPWHRSCFNVRTGKVTQGPAKVDLETFEVAVRDGQIMIRKRSDIQSTS